ncbi:MAG: alpha/beta hydrolase [Oscillospiraceae bacterium]|nr:alpha/beta hydrolase [Oscillospiraceae bacterium]
MLIVYILGALVLLYILVTLALFLVSFLNLDKSPELPVKKPMHIQNCKAGYAEFDAMEKEDVWIQSHDGYALHGYFIPNQKANKVVISFHGYNTEARKEYPLHHSYYQEGYTVLIVDQRGVGQSKGRFITMGLLERFDCLRWIDYVINRYDGDVEILLEGLSMGASTVMMAAQDIRAPQVKGMIVNCGFDSCSEQLEHTVTKLMHLPGFPVMHTVRFYAKLLAKYDMDAITASESLAKSDIPILMFHGMKDTFVPYINLAKIFPHIKAAHKKMIPCEHAAHGIARFEDRELYEGEIHRFLSELDF